MSPVAVGLYVGGCWRQALVELDPQWGGYNIPTACDVAPCAATVVVVVVGGGCCRSAAVVVVDSVVVAVVDDTVVVV